MVLSIGRVAGCYFVQHGCNPAVVVVDGVPSKELLAVELEDTAESGSFWWLVRMLVEFGINNLLLVRGRSSRSSQEILLW